MAIDTDRVWPRDCVTHKLGGSCTRSRNHEDRGRSRRRASPSGGLRPAPAHRPRCAGRSGRPAGRGGGLATGPAGVSMAIGFTGARPGFAELRRSDRHLSERARGQSGRGARRASFKPHRASSTGHRETPTNRWAWPPRPAGAREDTPSPTNTDRSLGVDALRSGSATVLAAPSEPGAPTPSESRRDYRRSLRSPQEGIVNALLCDVPRHRPHHRARAEHSRRPVSPERSSGPRTMAHVRIPRLLEESCPPRSRAQQRRPTVFLLRDGTERRSRCSRDGVSGTFPPP